MLRTECCRLPRAGRQHLGRQVRLLLHNLQCILWALAYSEGYDLLQLEELSFLEVGKNLAVVGFLLFDYSKLVAGDIFD